MSGEQSLSCNVFRMCAESVQAANTSPSVVLMAVSHKLDFLLVDTDVSGPISVHGDFLNRFECSLLAAHLTARLSTSLTEITDSVAYHSLTPKRKEGGAKTPLHNRTKLQSTTAQLMRTRRICGTLCVEFAIPPLIHISVRRSAHSIRYVATMR